MDLERACALQVHCFAPTRNNDMKKFAYITAPTVEQVIPLLDATTRPLAGGTDLLTEMKEDIVTPERLVSLRRLPGLRGIARDANGLRIGALTTLSDLERSLDVRDGPYAALALAARSAASPQLRNAATIGGNLLQDVRCWYYRGPFNCWLKGGEECYARNGEHHLHALFQQSPCIAPQPSDPATALLALDAQVEIQDADGARSVALLELLAPPTDTRRKPHTLGPAELIVGLTLPTRDGWRSVYHKGMERATYAFALVGVAAAIRMDGEKVAEARIALGGVANTPVLAETVAASLIGQPLTPESIAAAAAKVADGAQPLPQTAYKQELVVRMVAAALQALV
jgi:xanthine dehydrogenase YagS FAD-binding subunit